MKLIYGGSGFSNYRSCIHASDERLHGDLFIADVFLSKNRSFVGRLLFLRVQLQHPLHVSDTKVVSIGTYYDGRIFVHAKKQVCTRTREKHLGKLTKISAARVDRSKSTSCPSYGSNIIEQTNRKGDSCSDGGSIRSAWTSVSVRKQDARRKKRRLRRSATGNVRLPRFLHPFRATPSEVLPSISPPFTASDSVKVLSETQSLLQLAVAKAVDSFRLECPPPLSVPVHVAYGFEGR